MFPRLPEQPGGRRRTLLPLVLAALALVALGLGWARDDTGFIVLGVVCLAGAALSFISSTVVRSERPDHDDDA